MPSHQPLTAAERQRRYRERAREQMRVMRSDVPADLTAVLVENGWISEAEADDPDTLGAVLVDLVDCWARNTLRPPQSECQSVTPLRSKS